MGLRVKGPESLHYLFLKFEVTPCKAKHPLQGTELQKKKKKHKKIKALRKFLQKEPTINKCLSNLDLNPIS